MVTRYGWFCPQPRFGNYGVRTFRFDLPLGEAQPRKRDYEQGDQQERRRPYRFIRGSVLRIGKSHFSEKMKSYLFAARETVGHLSKRGERRAFSVEWLAVETNCETETWLSVEIVSLVSNSENRKLNANNAIFGNRLTVASRPSH